MKFVSIYASALPFVNFIFSCFYNAGRGLVTINTLRPRQNGRHFPDDIFKCILLNENVWFPIKFSLMFVPKGPINNIPALVQIMAWRRPGDKPLSEPMMVSLSMHICISRPQWVKEVWLTLSQILQTCTIIMISIPLLWTTCENPLITMSK